MMHAVLLENHLKPLSHLLMEPNINEISINKPKEVWVERRGGMVCEKIPELTFRHLKNLTQLIATDTQQYMSEEYPLLSAHLPGGYRIQIIYPPVVVDQTIGISIRKMALPDHDLNWYANPDERMFFEPSIGQKKIQQQLTHLYDTKQYDLFLRFAIEHKRNILISGGTSTGKTTFLNMLLRKIPAQERIITIEDIPEIQVTQPNVLSLFASRNQQGRAKVEMQDLVEASLRLRPDRIIIGELRGSEAFSFLRAVNTGHPGAIATLHANTPQLAFEQLILMVMQKNLGFTHSQIDRYSRMIIDVIVQLKKGKHGVRYVSDIYFKK